MELNETFDTVAELYDRARASYPAELVDDLVAVLPGPRVLEIAPGPGTLTKQLVERGVTVHGVEMGENLAALARRYATVTVERFEDWVPDGEYDAIVCAAAWHWLDPGVAPARAWAALRAGGLLAVIGGHHVCPPDVDPFFVEIQKTYEAIGQRATELPRPEDIRHDYVRSLEASRLFDIDTRGYLRVIEYTADTYIEVLNTFSGHIAMTEEQRSTLHTEVRRLIGPGTVGKHHLFCLHLARKVG